LLAAERLPCRLISQKPPVKASECTMQQNVQETPRCVKVLSSAS
jgi:hypothetical protein